jgi:hypothetical protein
VDAVEDPAPNFLISSAPSGMQINAGSGLISWTPDFVGDVTVSVQALN